MKATLPMLLLVIGVLASCGTRTDEPGTPPPVTSTTPTTTADAPTSSPAGPAGPARALPVYYVVDTTSGLRLYREFHSVPTTEDDGTDALTELFASPAGTDPDYRSFWPDGAALHAPVRHEGGEIIVDLTPASVEFSPGGPQALFVLQQLVYTVQGALGSTDPVRLLVGGAPRADLWGSVSVAEPIERGDPYQLRSLVQIDAPAHGHAVGRTFQVSGEAAAYEANVPWDLLRDGQVVQRGFATAQEGQRFAPYRFEVTLDAGLGPGEYTLRIMEDDASGGQGRPPLEDTKLIRVSG